MSLKKTRESRGLKQCQLADLAGIDAGLLCRIEKGTVDLDLAAYRTVAGLAGALDMDVSSFVQQFRTPKVSRRPRRRRT